VRSTTRHHVVSPAELTALRDLELLTRATVEGLRQGLHRSPFHGFSAEFSQYRHYRPGDDLKYVDWKAFGRTDRLYSRQFRETTNLGALFVVDCSRSMAFPEGAPTKFDRARAAAAVLAALVIDQGDAAGLLALPGDESARIEYLPARSGRHHLRLHLAALARLTSSGAAGVAAALRRAGGLLRRRGLVVVISDLYEDEAALVEIRRLARMGHDVVVIQIMARQELTLPRGGAIEFVDLETGARLVTSPDGVAADYARNVEGFLRRVRQAVEGDGLDYLRLLADEPLEPALRRFLIGRRGRA
jgi:uncharacterized protein (DUF58 family)